MAERLNYPVAAGLSSAMGVACLLDELFGDYMGILVRLAITLVAGTWLGVCAWRQQEALRGQE